jgi:hypothetical protein
VQLLREHYSGMLLAQGAGFAAVQLLRKQKV